MLLGDFFLLPYKCGLVMITALAQMQSQKQLQNRSASQVIALDNKLPFTSLESGLCPIWHMSSFRPTMTIFVFPRTHLGFFMYYTYRRFETKWWFSFQLSILVCLHTAASLLRKWEIIQNRNMTKIVLPFFLFFTFRLAQGNATHSKIFKNVNAQ